MEKEVLSRANRLFKEYRKFIKSLDKDNIEENITIDKLVCLKSVLSNVNNIMTLIATWAVAEKLVKALDMSDQDKTELFRRIDEQSSNANGFDVVIESPRKVLVEVKCNVPVHGTKFGAAQLRAILSDVEKLRLDKSANHKKVCKDFQDTKEYVKIVAIVNFNPQEIRNADLIEQITGKRKEDTARLDDLSEITDLKDLEKVYIAILSTKDLEEALKEKL